MAVARRKRKPIAARTRMSAVARRLRIRAALAKHERVFEALAAWDRAHPAGSRRG